MAVRWPQIEALRSSALGILRGDASPAPRLRTPREKDSAMNMATPRNPKALKSSVAAWGDVRESLTWLFTPALIAFLILLALESVKTLILPLPNSTADFELKRLSYEAVKMILLVPYIIAVHRFIILGEITTGCRIAIGKPRPWRFSGWSLAFLVVGNSPTTIPVLLHGEATLGDILGVVLGISTTVAAIPAMVLFPAVAVDAAGANWRQAILDASGPVIRYPSSSLDLPLPMLPP
jgi:hypothetical protein